MKLGEVLKKWRLVSSLDLREVAASIGISTATLMRIEHGRPCDSTTLMAILNWLFKKAN